MRSRIFFLLVIVTSTITAQTKKDYPIQPVPFTQVKVEKGFWFDRMETNRTVTIPYALKLCEETGRIKNFAIAGGLEKGDFCSKYYFDDSDVYKVIEGASYALMLKPDKELEKQLDKIISLISSAQEKDGYLYTARTMGTHKFERVIGPSRWLNEEGSHELYNVGHLYEAAVAHFMATKKKTLLNVALKNANLVCNVFGPGKISLPSGHQEIEIGLVKLYRVTGKEKYLKLAKFLLDMRGDYVNGRKSWGEYNQDHKPVIEQDEAVGHAVRAGYMYSGMADVAALTGDKDYLKALDKIWNNVAGKKLYLTGGVGATGSWEGFGKNYDLPNASAYNETCASIANVFWNHRMFLLSGEAKYLDVMERTLYNALLSGISMKGNSFFYPNPLESFGTHERAAWFDCACCPTNVTRFISSVANYMYAVKGNELFVNLFTNNETEIKLNNGKVNLKQRTNYPWDGKIMIVVSPNLKEEKFSLNIRIPGWSQNEAIASDLYKFIDQPKEKIKLAVNEKPIVLKIENGFAVINRNWKAGDMIELELPMEIKRVAANENVEADKGRVALQRGPIVYAAEWVDNKDGYVRNILLNDNSRLTAEYKPELLNGVEVIKGNVLGYRLADDKKNLKQSEQEFIAIPYYSWAHRGKGEMSVWLASDESTVRPLLGPTILTNAKLTVSHGKNLQAMIDQLEPKSSIDESLPYFHWWPSKGEKEFVQLDFTKPEEISEVFIYWFDDTGIGECKVPTTWKILYKEGEKWPAVYTTDKYGVEKDKYNSVIFETVRTQSIKIEIQSQKDFAGGIHEIKTK
ncbi:MAG: glycoside hydrolase family 127 protein [Ignavibacteriales bacterium]|nr:MAG: glycoside hydrolase family 127 protein [Ignavibacteriales bacterium]